jgi:hypothetical protein
MIAALVASLLLVVVGWPFAAWLDERGERLDRRIGEAYLLGAALVVAILFFLTLVHIRWSLPILLGMMLLAAVAAVVVRGRVRASLSGLRPRLHVIDLLTALLVAGYIRFATWAPTVEYDFIGIWGVKAKEFFLAHGIDWKFLENPFNEFAHVDYPLLVPLVFDHYAIVAGQWPDRWLGVVNVCFGVATLLIVRGFVAEETESPLVRALVMLAVVSSALSPWIGLAEGPLVAYGTAGVLWVRRGVRRGSDSVVLSEPVILSEAKDLVRGSKSSSGILRVAQDGPGPLPDAAEAAAPHLAVASHWAASDVTRGAIFLGAAAMCKNEGLTLIIAVAVGLALAGAIRLIPRLWPAAVIAAPWLVLRSMHHLQTDLTTGSMAGRAIQHLGNLQPMIDAMRRYPLGRPLFWGGIIVAILVGVPQVARRERFLATAVLCQLLFFIAAYIVTPRDVAWHIRWSWERIVDQLGVLLVLLAFAASVRPREESPSS